MLEFYTALLVFFSSWPHNDFTPLSRSVTCTFLASPFSTSEMFLEWDIIPLAAALQDLVAQMDVTFEKSARENPCAASNSYQVTIQQ